ncbi:MAG: hypothetical protein IPI21_13395 [Propionivibrio sp.]|nr:hypothetical protein [Propionivibrio sp.]
MKPTTSPTATSFRQAPAGASRTSTSAHQVDGSVGDQPAFLCRKIENDRLLASQFQNLTLLGAVRGRVEVLDRLAYPQARANGIHPPRLIKDAINGGPQTV